MGRWVDGLVGVKVDGWGSGWIDGWMEGGKVDGRIKRWVDG